MVTHADQLVQHPVQMPGQPRRLYLLGALGSIIGTPAALLVVSYLGLSDSSTVFVLALVLAGGSVVVGQHLMRAAMWHVRTRDLDRLPQWPVWVGFGLETALVLSVATMSMRSGNGVIQLAWVALAAMAVVMALCSILGWALTLMPQPGWLTAITVPRAGSRVAARSALKLTTIAVLISGTVWMHYDATGITEWAVASAHSAGWSQSRIDAIPNAHYGIVFAEIGAAVGLAATLCGWMIRVVTRNRPPVAA